MSTGALSAGKIKFQAVLSNHSKVFVCFDEPSILSNFQGSFSVAKTTLAIS
jgi:hypothetical protein